MSHACNECEINVEVIGGPIAFAGGKIVPLTEIELPATSVLLSLAEENDPFIDEANEAIERFMLADQEVIENFVTCDFHLAKSALAWVQRENLLTGERFCELGSGFGVVAMLAANMGMDAIGIEIEQILVDQANDLAMRVENPAKFYCGSFIPYATLDELDVDRDIQNVSVEEGHVYRDIGSGLEDYDLFFAFPWPGEQIFFEQVLDKWAANGAMLLTYRGRDGMQLQRKV